MSIQIATYEKTATALKDYAIDWSAYLEPDERLVSVSYNVAPVGLTVGVGAYAATIDTNGKGCVVWLSGGVVGTSYTVTCHVTTDNVPPRIDDRDIIINVTAPAAILPPPAASEAGMIYTYTGLDWAQRRFAIIPDLIPGSLSPGNAATNSARIAAACNVRDGGWVHIPEGTYAVNNIAMGGVRSGVTLTGPERGMRRGGFVDTPWKTQAGVQFQCYDTVNPFLTMCDEGMAGHFEVWYPNQATGASAPIAYPPTFDVSFFGCTLTDWTVVNPYELMRVRVAGFQAEKIYSFPLHRGVWLQRMPDCARIHDFHFNPNLGLGTSGGGIAAIGSGGLAHALANGIAFIVDGAEGYSFTDCFCGGYARGLHLGDVDADGFKGGSGLWYGGGWDQCVTCIFVDAAQAIGLTGLVVTNAGIIPYAGGNGIHFGDTAVPAAPALRPRIECHGCLFDSPGGNLGILMPAASYGVCRVIGGVMQNIAIGGFNDSANAYLALNGVTTVAASVPVRTAGASPNITDVNGLTL
jgi:hypothetical protein